MLSGNVYHNYWGFEMVFSIKYLPILSFVPTFRSIRNVFVAFWLAIMVK